MATSRLCEPLLNFNPFSVAHVENHSAYLSPTKAPVVDDAAQGHGPILQCLEKALVLSFTGKDREEHSKLL